MFLFSHFSKAPDSQTRFSNKNHKPKGKELGLNLDTNYPKYLRE